LQVLLRSPLSGWMGHSEPFAFAPSFAPAPDIRKFLTGTPSILSLAALEAGLDSFENVNVADLEKKARELSAFFVGCVETLCGGETVLASPREPGRRGSHVVFAHRQGYAVMQALIARGVVGDFRPPDLMRFGFAPLYNSFEDAWRASSALFEILASREWERPDFQDRQRVT
jgi:kynureninase